MQSWKLYNKLLTGGFSTKKYLCLIIVLMLALAPGCADKDNTNSQNDKLKSPPTTSVQNEKAGKPVKKSSQEFDNDNKASGNGEKPSYKETGKVIQETA